MDQCKLSWNLALAAAFFLPTRAGAVEDEPFAFRGSLTWLQALHHATLVEDSPLNPANAVLRLPHDSLVSELRPDLKLVKPTIQLLVRPRLRLNYELTKVVDKAEPTHGYAQAVLNEGYLQWMLSESLYFIYGLQSYQWGPGESLSPSNRLFHETSLMRTFAYEAKGKYLGRVNYSPRENISLVLMSEYKRNTEDDEFQADRVFASKALGKAELNWDGGASYFALVVGGREHGRPWLGQYLNLALPLEGLSIYLDAAVERGSDAFYPVNSTRMSPSGKPLSITQLEATRQDSRVPLIMAVAGLRYDFVGGTIVRGEWILNEAGYDRDERDRLIGALDSQEPLQQAGLSELLKRALAPGLDLPGRHYAYASVYSPDLFAVKDLAARGQLLYSLSDQSASAYVAVDYATGDAGAIFWSSRLSRGERDSELATLIANSHTLGYRHVW